MKTTNFVTHFEITHIKNRETISDILTIHFRVIACAELKSDFNLFFTKNF